ncbi:hypothetical protein Q0590_17615 [Rhodocytophaga aerolata]|uniref:Glyoxalase/fosfomycin resistance/dioxygenase domain-containing protein n=1 Tax=Rhodocytophaga aerolata TaxID=455078 RepID=A0ABT8R7L5_9BACT|nr:hypothetical protein [Rhodocytophaga aerolata]MDO1448096.1 hypothetical protein [Rhodocytophaga aerolata]
MMAVAIFYRLSKKAKLTWFLQNSPDTAATRSRYSSYFLFDENSKIIEFYQLNFDE